MIFNSLLSLQNMTFFDQHNSFLLGIGISCTGAFFGALGDSLVRKAYLDAPPSAQIRDMLRVPAWWFGNFCSVVLNLLCSLLSLYLIPVAIVTAFAGAHILFAVCLSKVWLRERVIVWDVVGAVFEVTGIITIIYGAQPSDEPQDFKSVIASNSTVKGIVFVSTVGGCIAIGILMALGVCSRLSQIAPIERVYIPITCGLCGGFSNIFAKEALLGLQEVFRDNVSMRIQIFLVGFSVIALISGSLQLFFLNQSLKRYPAGTAVPLVNSALIVCGVVGAICLLNEYPTNPFVFSVGVVLVVAGVALLFVGYFDDPSSLLAPLVETASSLTDNEMR